MIDCSAILCFSFETVMNAKSKSKSGVILKKHTAFGYQNIYISGDINSIVGGEVKSALE